MERAGRRVASPLAVLGPRAARERMRRHRANRAVPPAATAAAAGRQAAVYGLRGQTGAREGRHVKPIHEDELAVALDRLEALQTRAAENVALQGRDPTTAHVLLEHWAQTLSGRRIRLWRFRQIVDALVRRDLVHLDGPFASLVGWRAGAGALHSSPSNRTSGVRP